MKIVFFIGSLGHGGAESVVATLTSQLAVRGHDITLVSHLGNQFYHVSNNVNLIDVRNWQYDTYKGSLAVRIYKKSANRFLDFVNIKKIIKENKPDIVISFIAAWPTILAILCYKRLPLIFAERNAMVYPHTRFNFITKHILYRMAFAVQVMSKYDKAWVRNMYRRVYPMPNPLRFTPLSKENYITSFENRKNILACGRVNHQKGFEKLIEAFSSISSKYPDWNIDICGLIENEKYYQGLLALIEKLGLIGRINFLGGRNDVEQIMQEHAVFCLSSQHEGFPNVLSEAMSKGMACVSFDIVTGPSEIIIDGLDGIIVEDQDVKQLAVGLDLVIGNKDLRYSLGIHAIENISRYSKNRIVSKWENMFANVKDDFLQCN